METMWESVLNNSEIETEAYIVLVYVLDDE